MSEAYKCDMTGKLLEGSGVKQLAVDTPKGRLLVIPQVAAGKNRFAQGVVSPEAAEQIRKLLAPLATKNEAGSK